MSTDKQRKQRQKEPKSQPSNGTDRLKTVVRRLPPNLPEDVFWQSVQAWVSDETVTWKAYHPGKLRTKRVGKEGIPSRAYIAFRNEALVTTFSRAYDGHVFRDKAGNESHAVVEYAPFQKVPMEKKKVDARNKTIDKDEDYISFLETLQSAKPESVSLEALVTASQTGPQPTTTPLLEALKAEKSAQRDKEAILRNHAHYKDVGTKKEDKKKATSAAAPPPPAPQQQGKAEPVSGKKGKKPIGQKAQEGQAGKGGLGKSMHGPVPAAASTSAVSASASPASGHGRRPPKDRLQVGKDTLGHASAPALAPTTETPTSSPGAVPAQGRKNRPVIGLGRQFEAALSGAGVGVQGPVQGERKRRDKGGEGGAGAEASPVTIGKGKQKHREERAHAEVVPSILQRPVEAPDVVVMQRPQSTEGMREGIGPAPGAGAGPSPGPGSGSGGRGVRRGRGRGRGYRGG